MTTEKRPAGDGAIPADQAGGRSAASVAPDGDNRAAAAARRRQQIQLLLESMTRQKEKIHFLVTEAKEHDDHLALGTRRGRRTCRPSSPQP